MNKYLKKAIGRALVFFESPKKNDFSEIVSYFQRKKNFSYKKPLLWINRSDSNSRLVIIVAGFQDYLWEKTFRRYRSSFPTSTDFVIVVPKGMPNTNYHLIDLCEKYKFSILIISENKLALAQNQAITLHPFAKKIHKIDEDIFLSCGYGESLEGCYEQVTQDGIYNPSLMVPSLNVNGVTYHDFLKHMGCLSEYERQFSRANISCVSTQAWSNPSACRYLWEIMPSIDETARFFSGRNDFPSYYISPCRFSIGAILFHRDLWELIGGWDVSGPGRLGDEEAQIAKWAANNSRPICISKNTFAAHFSFGPQKDSMKKLLIERPNLFD